MVNYPAGGWLGAADGLEPIRQTVREAAARGLRVRLYDEDGYPSGAAGGMVLAGQPELEASGVSWAWLTLDGREGVAAGSAGGRHGEPSACGVAVPDGRRRGATRTPRRRTWALGGLGSPWERR